MMSAQDLMPNPCQGRGAGSGRPFVPFAAACAATRTSPGWRLPLPNSLSLQNCRAEAPLPPDCLRILPGVRCAMGICVRRAHRTQHQKFRAGAARLRLQLPFRERVRLCSGRRIQRASLPVRAGARALPLPWFSTAIYGIAPPQLCTSARLRHARRLSPATAPIRMPPWHRACVRRVLPVLPPRRCPLLPCVYGLGSVASQPWLSIVAATGACGQNLNSLANQPAMYRTQFRVDASGHATYGFVRIGLKFEWF